MYIQISSDPEAPAAISRKLHKALGFDNSKNPCGAISISQIKGRDTFAIIRRTPQETFQTQCSLVTPHPKRSRKTPSVFHFTIPSWQYIMAVTRMKPFVGGKIVKVSPITLPGGMTIYELQTNRP